MTHVERTLQVLEEARRLGEIRIDPHDAVEAIVQAGLLAPNLPAPTKIDDYVYCWSKTHTHLMNNWSAGVATEVEARGGVTALAWDDDAQVWIDVDHGEQILTPEDARSLGLALLAAANHAEENQCPR